MFRVSVGSDGSRISRRRGGHQRPRQLRFENYVRRDLFYLLDYVTPSEIFQIGDRKKKRHGEINRYVP